MSIAVSGGTMHRATIELLTRKSGAVALSWDNVEAVADRHSPAVVVSRLLDTPGDDARQTPEIRLRSPLMMPVWKPD